MARGLGSTITTELAKDRLRFADLLELHFESPNDLYLTNGPLDITVDTDTSTGKTFAANGELLTFDTITETGQARVNQINFALSGASKTITNLFLNNNYVDRRIVIYRHFFNNESVAIGTPVMLFDGEMTAFQINESGTSSTVSVTSSSVFYDFDRIAGRRTNTTSQQTHYAFDKGMDFASVVDDRIKWGKP